MEENFRTFHLLDGENQTTGKYNRFNKFDYPPIRAGRLRSRNRNVNYTEIEEAEMNENKKRKGAVLDADEEEYDPVDVKTEEYMAHVGNPSLHAEQRPIDDLLGFGIGGPSLNLTREKREILGSNKGDMHGSRDADFKLGEPKYSSMAGLNVKKRQDTSDLYEPAAKRQKLSRRNPSSISQKRGGAFDHIQRQVLETVWCKGHYKDKSWQDFTAQLTELQIKQVRQWFADRQKKAKKSQSNVDLPTPDNPWKCPDIFQKQGTTFSTAQKTILEKAFAVGILEGNKEPPMVAILIGLSTKQVKQWKSDKKKKLKKQTESHSSYQSMAKQEGPDDQIMEEEDKEGLDDSFSCCGYGLKTEGQTKKVLCKKCNFYYHESCLLWLFDIDSDSLDGHFTCPRCHGKNVRFPQSIQNGRGDTYNVGCHLEATDDAKSQWHAAKCSKIGNQRIMVHYVGFSHEHNQWLDPELDLLRLKTKKDHRRGGIYKTPRMDDNTAKKWLNIAWDKGVLAQSQYHEALASLTGWSLDKIKRSYSEKKFQTQRNNLPIPQLAIPQNTAPNEESNNLLKYVAHHSLLDDPKFFNAWCALAGLSQSGLTQWIAEYNYVNQRKKQHVHVQREDNGLPSKPTLSEFEDHILSHMALTEIEASDYILLSRLIGTSVPTIQSAVDYYRN